MNDNQEQINQMMKDSDFSNALKLIKQLMKKGEEDAGIFYMAGQCSRYLNNIKDSIIYHEKATKLDLEYPSFQLALGIAYQIDEQYEKAHNILSNLILNNQEWGDLDLAFNSLALTQKKMGLFDRAEKNYNQSIQIFLFNIVKSLSNSKDNQIVSIKPTTNNLWFKYLIETATIFSKTFENIDRITFPETTNDKYKGLYWIIEKINNRNTLLFLPNFFGTLRQYLIYEPGYFNTIGNMSSIFAELGNTIESEKYLTEAKEIMSEYQERKDEV